MIRQDWIIEHAGLGTYLGDGTHPRKFTRMPLFRADDTRKPSKRFVSILAAQAEADLICSAKHRPIDPAMLSIIGAWS